MAKIPLPSAVKPETPNQVNCTVLYVEPKGRLSVLESKSDGGLFVLGDSKLDGHTSKLVPGQIVSVKSSRIGNEEFRLATNSSVLPFAGTVTDIASFGGEINGSVFFHKSAFRGGTFGPGLMGKNVRYSLEPGYDDRADAVVLDS